MSSPTPRQPSKLSESADSKEDPSVDVALAALDRQADVVGSQEFVGLKDLLDVDLACGIGEHLPDESSIRAHRKWPRNTISLQNRP